MPDNTTRSGGSRTPENKNQAPVFNKNDLYEKEVAPLLDALHKACLKHEMPLLVVVSSSRFANAVDPENDEVAEDFHIAGASGPDDYVPAPLLLGMNMVKSHELFRKIYSLVRLILR